MQDEPTASEMLLAVNTLLRETVMPKLDPHTAYLVRVAANGVDLARRQMELAPASDAAEHERLVALLGRDGSLLELNRALVDAIEAREMSLETPGLAAHLWATTMAKLAVDQPSYAAYKAEL